MNTKIYDIINTTIAVAMVVMMFGFMIYITLETL